MTARALRRSAFAVAALVWAVGAAFPAVAARGGAAGEGALADAALGPEARPSAPVLAAAFVPLRQLAAVAVTAWAVWVARKTRDGE